MMNINDIINSVLNNRINFTYHVKKEAEEDQLSFGEILESLFQGEIIEEYPEDKPFPSCLIYGNNLLRRADSQRVAF